MKVVILSKGSMLINLIKGAQDAGCEVVGILRYDKVVLNKFQLFLHDFFKTNPDVTFIKKFHIPEINAVSANSEVFKEFLIKHNIDIMIVGTWREKISKETFDIPKIASINLHPALLPKYRGANPYYNAIKNLEKKSGLTFHLIDEKFDHGAILSQKEVDILPCDTGKELKNKIIFETRAETSKLLHDISTETVIPIEQDEKNTTYCDRICSENLMLNFKNNTAEEIHAQIRSLHPWAPAYITIGKHFLIPDPYKLEIIKAKEILHHVRGDFCGEIIAKDDRTASLTVVCKDGNAVKMDGLKLYGFFNRPFTKLFIKNLKN